MIEKYIEIVLSHPVFKSSYSEKNCKLLGVEPVLETTFFKTTSKLCLVTGESATGKSYFIKELTKYLSSENVLVYHSGMVHRTGDPEKGFMEHLGSLILEDMASTGENSTILLLKGIKSNYAKEHVIIFDEPALGLSQGYMFAVSDAIKEYVQKKNNSLLGVVVCEHNEKIISNLLKLNPNHLRFGDEKDLDEVLSNSQNYDVKDLLNLPEKGAKLRRQISEIEQRICEFQCSIKLNEKI
ncbi:MAG: hypothetical protein WC758_04780 [Candidatus Woesearchaeota archaeon]|jgi:hypothetical protein